MLRLTNHQTNLIHSINPTRIAVIQDCESPEGYDGPPLANIVTCTGAIAVTTAEKVPSDLQKDWLTGFSIPYDLPEIHRLNERGGLVGVRTFATKVNPIHFDYFICCPATHNINGREYAHLIARVGNAEIDFFMEFDPFAPLPDFDL